MQRERRKNNDILFHFRKDGLPMAKLSQLKIDPEFQKQINPPSFEETHQLEMNILKEERVLNPIITWNGYIVDGHNPKKNRLYAGMYAKNKLLQQVYIPGECPQLHPAPQRSCPVYNTGNNPED